MEGCGAICKTAPLLKKLKHHTLDMTDLNVRIQVAAYIELQKMDAEKV